MSIRTADIAFPEKGLVLVLGSNLAADGKLQSIGAGKTGIGEALACALVGAEGRFAHTSYYVPDDQPGNTYVRVDAELLEKPLVVELGVRCPELSKTGESLRFTYDGGTPVQRKTPEQTRTELCRTLQVTPELANWTVFLDGDKLKFNRMSQEDTVNLLMSALGQPPWTEYQERVKKKLDSANRQVLLSRQKLEEGKRSIDELERDVEDAMADYKQAKQDYKRQVDELAQKVKDLKQKNGADLQSIKSAEANVVKGKAQLKLLEEQHAQQDQQREITRQELRDQFAEIDAKWLEAADKKAASRSKANQADDLLERMRTIPKNCPTCGKPWDKAHSEEEIGKARKAADDAFALLDTDEGDFRKIERTRQETLDRLRAVEEEMKKAGRSGDVTHIADIIEGNEKLVINLQGMIHARELQIERLGQGVDKSFVNKKYTIIEERTRALDKAEKAVNQSATDLAMDEEVTKVVQYWHRAYGPTGIPNMVLSDAIPPMNRVAQRISSLMTGGTLAITYSTTNLLQSGESRAKLITKVENRIGSKRLEGSSKGEAGLTNLIIAENLNEIGQVSQRVGFRFYDEITNGQDGVVRRSVFAYLKEVANRLGILIFVVDHHVEAASYADYVLVAEKTKEEGTRYYWR